MTPNLRPVRGRRRRGTTLTEVILAAGISATVLIAGIGTFMTGMRSWVKGEANIDASSSSQKALRFVSDELREAMVISVDSSGKKVSYTRPKVSSDGSFTNPMIGDGINRSIERSGTTLVVRAGSTSRIIARDLLNREAGATSDYQMFTASAGSVSRSLTIKIVAGKPGFRGETIVESARETVFLRNVPQLSR